MVTKISDQLEPKNTKPMVEGKPSAFLREEGMAISVTTLKAAAVSLVLAGTMYVPRVLHSTAVGYLNLEESVNAKGYEMKLKGLRWFGLQPVPTEKTIDELIEAAATKYKIDATILHAMAMTESNKSPVAQSVKGAIGILQIMPANAARCGLPHAGKLWDEATNIDCGAQIVSQERSNYKKWEDVFRAYNGGPQCVRSRCSESEQYVVKVMNNIGQRVLRG